jgi:polyhydroxyalkanoate synthesis regulator phasin
MKGAMMSFRKRLAMGGVAATLALVLGATVLSPVVAGAQESTTTTTDATGGDDAAGTGRVDRIRGLLDDLVTDGTITSAQADAVAEHLAEYAFRGHFGRRGHHLLVGLEVAAEAIGIERSALIDALQNGQTIAEVAAANGVETQAVIDALVNAHQQMLDELVADGTITADEAAERAATAAERITDFVNGDFRFGPRLGVQPDPGDPSTSSTTGA